MPSRRFFLDIDLLHLCGPTALHLFRRDFPYSSSWEKTWRNHALVARVCYDERTWFEHWLPKVFSRDMTPETEALLESEGVLQEHAAFQRQKVRPDREFWRGVLNQEEPPCLRP